MKWGAMFLWVAVVSWAGQGWEWGGWFRPELALVVTSGTLSFSGSVYLEVEASPGLEFFSRGEWSGEGWEKLVLGGSRGFERWQTSWQAEFRGEDFYRGELRLSWREYPTSWGATLAWSPWDPLTLTSTATWRESWEGEAEVSWQAGGLAQAQATLRGPLLRDWEAKFQGKLAGSPLEPELTARFSGPVGGLGKAWIELSPLVPTRLGWHHAWASGEWEYWLWLDWPLSEPAWLEVSAARTLGEESGYQVEAVLLFLEGQIAVDDLSLALGWPQGEVVVAPLAGELKVEGGIPLGDEGKLGWDLSWDPGGWGGELWVAGGWDEGEWAFGLYLEGSEVAEIYWVAYWEF